MSSLEAAVSRKHPALTQFALSSGALKVRLLCFSLAQEVKNTPTRRRWREHPALTFQWGVASVQRILFHPLLGEGGDTHTFKSGPVWRDRAAMQSESQSDCRCAPVCQPGRCSGAPAAVGWCKVKQRSLAFTRGAACFLLGCCRCFLLLFLLSELETCNIVVFYVHRVRGTHHSY